MDQLTDPSVPSVLHVSHPDLSLWQSAARQVAADRHERGNIRAAAVGRHPDVLAADAAVHAISSAAAAGAERSLDRHRGLSELLRLADDIHRLGAASDVKELQTTARAFSDQDFEFVLQCIPKFIEWYWLGRHPVYRDWRKEGGGDIGYGLIERRLVSDARIGVIGDWGTGMDDARELLVRLLRECRPDILVHLGDVYYSGTPAEARFNFAGILEQAFQQVPPRIPVFNLPGNHDYYSGGRGFYELLDGLNERPDRQQASYFCLRSEDGRWQLVGLDTGVNDRTPGVPFNPWYTAPGIRPSEADWLADKLNGFDGRTVLFTHHQLFSAHSPLNGPRSGRERPNFNDNLAAAVRPWTERIALWMWGHEHSLSVYQPGLHGFARCRLVGCSAFEMGVRDDPYDVRFDDVPFAEPVVRLDMEQDWYNHGFAVIDLGRGVAEYYQFPSWSGSPPASVGPLVPLFTEPIV
jgi:Calcineurin-like phosphoesterase